MLLTLIGCMQLIWIKIVKPYKPFMHNLSMVIISNLSSGRLSSSTIDKVYIDGPLQKCWKKFSTDSGVLITRMRRETFKSTDLSVLTNL